MTAASAIAGWVSSSGLELGRGDLVALVLDELLDPVDDEAASRRRRRTPMSPVCSQPSASIIAAVASGPAEVALHHLRAADPDLAVLAGAERPRPVGEVDDAGISVPATSLPTVPGGGLGLRRRARRAVPRRQSRSCRRPGRPAAAEPRGAGRGELGVQRARPRRARTPATTGRSSSTAGCLARARTIGGATNRPVMRCFSMRREELLEVEAGQDDDGGAVPQRQRSSGPSARRCGRTGSTARMRSSGVIGTQGGDLREVGGDAAVGEHHALGHAGGARRSTGGRRRPRRGRWRPPARARCEPSMSSTRAVALDALSQTKISRTPPASSAARGPSPAAGRR